MNFCLVCEKELTEHNLLRTVFYCNSPRCTRLGVLTVFMLTPSKPEKPPETPKVPVVPVVPVEEVKKDDQNFPKP